MAKEPPEKGTQENPLTREDVLKVIEDNGGTAQGLDLSNKYFEEDINLFGLDLRGIILRGAVFPISKKFRSVISDIKTQMPHKDFAPLIGTRLAEANLQEADLSHAKLSGIDMRNTNLHKANLSFAQLIGTNLIYAQLQEANLEYANLTDAFLFGANLRNADISNTLLKGTNLRSTNMCGACIFDSLFDDADLRYIEWGDYVLGEEKRRQFRMAAANYRELRLYYNKRGFYDTAGEFFYREMECKRKVLHPFWLEIFNVLCGYGERPMRVIIWAASVIFGLAAAYYFWGTFETRSFADTLYYSAASFTALGYGQWAPQPTGWAKGMGVVEAVIGVFSMALFLVTFTRKMTR